MGRVDIWWKYGNCSCMVSNLIRYAVFIFIFVFILGGAYCAGYHVGSSDTKVEYVVKEVVKRVEVEKKKSEIYSKPNLNRDSLLRMYSENNF